MNSNNYSKLRGTHALFSPSNPSWLNYSEERAIEVYNNMKAKERGTKLHEMAANLIEENIKQRKTNDTFNMYVNDGIGYKMLPEQVLYYSDYCYGTADTISFRKDLLRIHDLKTGKNPAHMEQLEIYAALYCLEHGIRPSDIGIELRMYQNDEVIVHNPTSEDIVPIMDQIIMLTKVMEKINK